MSWAAGCPEQMAGNSNGITAGCQLSDGVLLYMARRQPHAQGTDAGSLTTPGTIPTSFCSVLSCFVSADYDNYIDVVFDASSRRAAKALKQVWVPCKCRCRSVPGSRHTGGAPLAR